MEFFNVHCSTCGVIFATEFDRHNQSRGHFCIQCTAARNAASDELQILHSRLAFLRLQPIRKPPDDIRKWDAVIVVQGNTDEPLHAHKFILSSKSHVFSIMFDIKMSEEETGTIYIDDATLPVIRAMIKFCYSAEIDFTDEVTSEEVLNAERDSTYEVTSEEVLKVAHKYQIALLEDICERHLIKTLNNSNLPKRLRLAKTFDARGLAAAATKHFKANFDKVIDDVLVELC